MKLAKVDQPHDIPEVISGKEILFLHIEQVEADLQALDLIVRQVGLLIDLFKVNIGVRIGLGHLDIVEFWKDLKDFLWDKPDLVVRAAAGADCPPPPRCHNSASPFVNDRTESCIFLAHFLCQQ